MIRNNIMKLVVILFLHFVYLPMYTQNREISPNISNIPSKGMIVFLVDGVDIDDSNLDINDIIKTEIVNDTNIIKYFYPRNGGVVCIKTKSKKYLKPIISKYKKDKKQVKKILLLFNKH